MLPVGKGQLGRFRDRMNIIRAIQAHRLEIKPFQQGQLLQKHRALAPGTTFIDIIATIVEGRRLFDPNMKGGQVFCAQQPPLFFRVGRYGLSDSPFIKLGPSRGEAVEAVATGPFFGHHQTPKCPGQVRVRYDLTDIGQMPARQIDLG